MTVIYTIVLSPAPGKIYGAKKAFYDRSYYPKNGTPREVVTIAFANEDNECDFTVRKTFYDPENDTARVYLSTSPYHLRCDTRIPLDSEQYANFCEDMEALSTRGWEIIKSFP